MGPILADYLIDYLPFETEQEPMMESVRLILQPGLLDDKRRLDLWKKSGRKNAYLVGFLHALPDALPEPTAPRADAGAIAAALAGELAAGNPCAQLLARVTGAPGQTFLATVSTVLAKPPTQEVVTAVFDVLRDYFAPMRPDGDPDLDIAALAADSQTFANPATAPETVQRCLDAHRDAAADIAAMRLLSGGGYGLLRPVLPDPTTLGTLMRRKLAPVTEVLQDAIGRLRGKTR
jgi:hypothetical protein